MSPACGWWLAATRWKWRAIGAFHGYPFVSRWGSSRNGTGRRWRRGGEKDEVLLVKWVEVGVNEGDEWGRIFLNLPQSQLGRLHLILNSSARAVSKTPKFAHISHVLKSIHWFEIEQCIQYKVASITYKVLQSEHSSYLHSLLNVQSYRTTRSSDIITLQRHSVRSRLKITNRSFTHHAPLLWHALPKQLWQPSAPPSHGTTTVSSTVATVALSSHQFHSKTQNISCGTILSSQLVLFAPTPVGSWSGPLT